MNLTESINDIVEQAASLLSPPNMDDWTPPADAPADMHARLEQEEYDRRAQSKVDAYLADRSDRLLCLRAIHEAAEGRAAAYKAQAVPWTRLAERQTRLAAYCEQLARNVLETERAQAGYEPSEPYAVTFPNGVKMALRQSPPALQIVDAAELPRRYVETVVTHKTLNDEIKKALKDGKVVPGAKLTRGTYVWWGR